MSIVLNSLISVHPGEWLKTEIIAAHDMNVSEAADRLHVRPQALIQLLNTHVSLSADMAQRFETLFGLKAETLMQMQASYDRAKDHERDGDWVRQY